MIKKVLAMAAAAVLALTLSGCGGSTVNLPALETETVSTASGGTQVSHKKPTKTYEDSLIGLLTYMEDGGAVVRAEGVTFENGAVTIAEDAVGFTQMSFKEIGAVNGYRYQFTFGGGTVQAEFYEFDPENLDEKARACIGSVSEKGFFVILDNEVQAVLHPSEKYLMVYTDPNAEKKDENKEQKAWAEELFLGFQE